MTFQNICLKLDNLTYNSIKFILNQLNIDSMLANEYDFFSTDYEPKNIFFTMTTTTFESLHNKNLNQRFKYVLIADEKVPFKIFKHKLKYLCNYHETNRPH